MIKGSANMPFNAASYNERLKEPNLFDLSKNKVKRQFDSEGQPFW